VHFALMASRNEKCTVQSGLARLPRRKPNVEYRSREHLTEREVERLIEAVKGKRWRHRDATMVLVPSDMACVHRNWSTFVGIRSILDTPSCTSVD
jgi:hypothetical protein